MSNKQLTITSSGVTFARYEGNDFVYIFRARSVHDTLHQDETCENIWFDSKLQ